MVRVNLNRAHYTGTVTYSDHVHTHVRRDDRVKGMGIGGGWIAFTNEVDPLPGVRTVITPWGTLAT